MKKFFISHMLKMVSVLALAVAISSANTCCQFIIHQPELPEKVKSLRQF